MGLWMHILFAVVLGAILLVAASMLYRHWRQSPGTCANCGSPSQFGYSEEAESKAKDIIKLCPACLAGKLKNEYQRYEGTALAIEPAAGLPCYVFQKNSRWADSRLAKEMNEMFSRAAETCNRCGSNAHFFWVTSNGLNLSNFQQLISNGLSETLLQWGNARPVPLCAECCVKSITKAIADRSLRFVEVCSPRTGDGFVIPMAY